MLAFRDRGAGPSVVFLHGFGLDGRAWAPQRDAFAGYRTVVPDLPGFGAGGAGAAGMVCPAEAVRELLDACAIDRAHVVGHSFGAAVAVDLALGWPERVRSLTIVDGLLLGRPADLASWPACRALARSGDLAEARRAWLADPIFAPAREKRALSLELERIVADYGCGQWSGRVSHRWCAEDHTARLRDVRAPALLVYGARDVPSFHRMAAEYGEGLRRARAVTLDGVGHCASMEAPGAFDDAVLRFLAEMAP